MRPTLARALLVAAALSYFVGAFQIDTPDGQYSALGPELFPILIGVGLLSGTLWIATTGAKTTSVNWRGVGAAAVTFLAYLALLPVVGFLPATVPFVTLEARVLGSHHWRRDLVVAVLLAAAVHGLLTYVLGVRLPRGLLG